MGSMSDTGDMSDRVTITLDGGVADVRLNRPEKLNALDPAMFAAIADAGESLKGEASLRAVVLSGEGRSFCAGLDFASFQAMSDAGSARGGGDEQASVGSITAIPEGRITHGGQQAVYVWRELPVPVIAAVTGHALGGGCQLALGADIRIVHPEARMSILEVRWGLVPDMCGTQFLPEIVGVDVAKELTWTGRMVSGAEAKELGLATRLSEDPHADALDLAGEIASKSPDAVRAAKRLLGTTDGYAEGFAAERQEIGALIGTPNQVEAVTAYFEKREPAFEG
jgi:enoyl-CoA hydratase/carnithine racemase